jgi:hypothetical protein
MCCNLLAIATSRLVRRGHDAAPRDGTPQVSAGYILLVSPDSRWGQTPRQSIEAECARRGKDAVVAGCAALLAGRECDAGLVTALGGPGARMVLDGGPGSVSWYWVRVWAARGLLWAWDDAALPAMRRAAGRCDQAQEQRHPRV